MSSVSPALQDRPPPPEFEPALILLYHRVASLPLDPFELCVSAEHFDAHMNVLARLGVTIGISDLGRPRPSRSHGLPSVVVTFDDGYADNVESAMPILERHGVPATMFVVTGGLDGPDEFWWDQLERALLAPGEVPERIEIHIAGRRYQWDLGPAAVLGATDLTRHHTWRAWEASSHARFPLYWQVWQLLHPLPPSERDAVVRAISEWAGVSTTARDSHRRATIQQLEAVAASPLVELGAHTVNHVSLGQVATDIQTREMVDSKRALQTTFGVPVSSFSYPFGKEPDVTAATVELARHAGFEHACVNMPGVVRMNTNALTLPRVHVPNVAPADFEWWLRAQAAL